MTEPPSGPVKFWRLRRGLAEGPGAATGSNLKRVLDELQVGQGQDFVIVPAVYWDRPQILFDPSADMAGPDSGGETSRQAALSNAPRSGTQRRRVLEAIGKSAIEGALPQGLTREELEPITGLDGNSVRPRVWELMQGGFVADSGRRRQTQDGNPSEILVPTDKGWAELRDETDELANYDGIRLEDENGQEASGEGIPAFDPAAEPAPEAGDGAGQ